MLWLLLVSVVMFIISHLRYQYSYRITISSTVQPGNLEQRNSNASCCTNRMQQKQREKNEEKPRQRQ